MSDFVNFLLKFTKDIMELPSLLVKIPELFVSIICLIPNPFRSISLTFIVVIFGIFIYKLWRG